MSDTILVTSVEREVIEVGVPGPQGATGATGATGPQGPAGTAGASAWADITGKPTFTDLATANSTDEDVEVTDATKGIILKSANATRFRLTVSNSGLPIFTALLWLMLASLAPAQVVGIGTTSSNAVVTDRTGTLTWSNAVSFPGLTLGGLTNDSPRVAILGTNGAVSAGSVPSGAAPLGAVWQSDGSGSSVASSTLAGTNSLVHTNGGNLTNTSFAVGQANTGIYGSGGILRLSANGVQYASTFQSTGNNRGGFGIRAGSMSFNTSVGIGKWFLENSNVIAQINDENYGLGNEYRIYGSATNNSTNYRRLSIGMSNSGIAYMRPEQAGTLTNGTNFLYISGLPATNTGLPSGVIWNSNGTVIVNP